MRSDSVFTRSRLNLSWLFQFQKVLLPQPSPAVFIYADSRRKAFIPQSSLERAQMERKDFAFSILKGFPQGDICFFSSKISLLPLLISTRDSWKWKPDTKMKFLPCFLLSDPSPLLTSPVKNVNGGKKVFFLRWEQGNFFQTPRFSLPGFFI